jgi:DNA-binding response OmpR family regulator
MTFRSFSLPERISPPSLTDQLRTIMSTNAVKKVLFADDDLALRVVVKELELTFQMEVTAVESCIELRSALESFHFDIVILDFQLANGNCADIYREILSKRPGCQVIFITGGSLDIVSAKIHQAGPAPVYPKPVAFALPFLVHLLADLGVFPRRPIGKMIRDDQAIAAGAV